MKSRCAGSKTGTGTTSSEKPHGTCSRNCFPVPVFQFSKNFRFFFAKELEHFLSFLPIVNLMRPRSFLFFGLIM